MYVRLKKSYSLDYDRALAVVYSVLTPFLNPFIYSLRNKEIKEAVRRQLKRIYNFAFKKSSGRWMGGKQACKQIITVILRIPSVEGRQKAFSTCASHLGVFVMFYGSVSLMYLRFSATFPQMLDTVVALMFAVLAPFFNPIIYSLRNKDMKIAIKKLLCFLKVFSASAS
ncbi:Olfactory receptor 6K3 [Manis javanica]|nr:Olfactory receptor 6K3 [Manis javanica]